MTATVSIPTKFDHHAAVYAPIVLRGPTEERIFSVVLPYSDEFTNVRRNKSGGVNAKSQKQPVIMIGNGTIDEIRPWENLTRKAADYRIPLDVLLKDRPLKVAYSLWTPRGPYSTGHDAINLIAVQILGDFTKSAVLDERIAEIKEMFE